MVLSQIPSDVLGDRVGPVARRRFVAGLLAVVACSAMIFVAQNIDLDVSPPATATTSGIGFSTLASNRILKTYEKLGIVTKAQARKQMMHDLRASTKRLVSRLAINGTAAAEGNTTGNAAAGKAPPEAAVDAADAEGLVAANTKTLVFVMGGNVNDFGAEQIDLLKAAVAKELGAAVVGNVTVSAGSVVAGVPIPGGVADTKVQALVASANEGAFQPVKGFPVTAATVEHQDGEGEHWGPMKYWLVLGLGVACMLGAVVSGIVNQ